MPSDEFSTIIRGKKTDKGLFDEELLDSEGMDPDRIRKVGFKGTGEKLSRYILLVEPLTFNLFVSKGYLKGFEDVSIMEQPNDVLRLSHNSGKKLIDFLSLLRQKKVKFKEL